MFFDWISLVAGGMALVSGFAEGRKAGGHGRLIGLAVGFAVGCGCFAVMKAIIQWLPERFGLYRQEQMPKARERAQQFIMWLLLLVAVAWLFVSAFLGGFVTRAVIHMGRT